MHSKLTLRLDSDLIESAKKIAESRNTSLSRIVAEYFTALLNSDPSTEAGSLPPKTRSLLGVLSTDFRPSPDESDYKDYLERKYS
jgi:hypothetical protein